MTKQYAFAEQLKLSREKIVELATPILLAKIPGAVAVHPAHPSNDRRGTDFWVEHQRGVHLSVDVKVRAVDWAAKPEPERADDLALETWSVVETGKIGWTRDPDKRTDYVLWIWRDTGRSCLVPFGYLCYVFRKNWEKWSATYKVGRQFTPEHGGYHSECVFVPRDEVWNEIYHNFS